MSDEATLGILSQTRKNREKEIQEYLERYRRTGNREPFKEKILGISDEDLFSDEESAKGGVSGIKSKIQDKAEEIKTQVIQKGVEEIKSKAKSFAIKFLVANPEIVLVIVIVIAAIVIMVTAFIVINKRVQDSTGVSITNICNTIGTDTCVKTISNQKGIALKNSTL